MITKGSLYPPELQIVVEQRLARRCGKDCLLDTHTESKLQSLYSNLIKYYTYVQRKNLNVSLQIKIQRLA